MRKQVKPCVSVEVLVMGPIENNVYIIGDGESTFVVDPTGDAPRIVEALAGRKLDAVVLTHWHWDHVGGACELRELTGAPTVAGVGDAPFITGEKRPKTDHMPFEPCPVDRTVEDGEELAIGRMRWKVLETPGHTAGGICLFLDPACGGDPEGSPVLVSGDTLFRGTHGRTDFSGGDPASMIQSLVRLSQLPGDTLVLPGHNDLTTIGAEGWLARLQA